MPDKIIVDYINFFSKKDYIEFTAPEFSSFDNFNLKIDTIADLFLLYLKDLKEFISTQHIEYIYEEMIPWFYFNKTFDKIHLRKPRNSKDYSDTIKIESVLEYIELCSNSNIINYFLLEYIFLIYSGVIDHDSFNNFKVIDDKNINDFFIEVYKKIGIDNKYSSEIITQEDLDIIGMLKPTSFQLNTQLDYFMMHKKLLLKLKLQNKKEVLDQLAFDRDKLKDILNAIDIKNPISFIEIIKEL